MDYVSTRGSAPALDFEGVTLAGLASDGGLYVPERWPAPRWGTAIDPEELADCLESLLYLLLFYDVEQAVMLRMAQAYDAVVRRVYGTPAAMAPVRRPGRLLGWSRSWRGWARRLPAWRRTQVPGRP